MLHQNYIECSGLPVKFCKWIGVGLITKEQQNNHHDHDLNYHFNWSEQQLTNKHFNLYCDWNHMVQIYIVKQNVIKHVYYLKQSKTDI